MARFRLSSEDWENGEMNTANVIPGCTVEQYLQVTLVVHRIMAEFFVTTSRAEISEAFGGGYTVEVLNVCPEQVAAMNMRLADEICRIDLLDDCKLIAHFSVERIKNERAPLCL